MDSCSSIQSTQPSHDLQALHQPTIRERSELRTLMHAIFPVCVARAHCIPKGKTTPGWTGLVCSERYLSAHRSSMLVWHPLLQHRPHSSLLNLTRLHCRLAVTPPAFSVSLTRDTDILVRWYINNHPNRFEPMPLPLVPLHRHPSATVLLANVVLYCSIYSIAPADSTPLTASCYILQPPTHF